MLLYSAVIVQLCMIAHFGFILPSLDYFTPFPQQTVLFVDIAIDLILEVLIIYSYCRKTFKFVRVIMVGILIIFQISVCLGPGPNVSKNFQALQGTLICIVTGTILVNCQSLVPLSTSNLNFAVFFTVANMMW